MAGAQFVQGPEEQRRAPRFAGARCRKQGAVEIGQPLLARAAHIVIKRQPEDQPALIMEIELALG